MIWRLTSCVSLAVALVSCKPVSEEGSGLMGAEKGTNSVDKDTVEQFNLAEYVKKNGVGGKNFSNNVIAGNKYIFFTSNEEEKVDKTNAAELKKSKNKSKLLKAEYELRMNATITSNSKTAEVKSVFWVDGSLNGTDIYKAGNAIESAIVGSAKSAISVKGYVKAFGKDLFSKDMSKSLSGTPLSLTKTVDLEYNQTVLGIPALAGVQAGVTFVAALKITGETDYISKESVTVSMVPDIKATAGIQGTVKALKFAQAKAAGTVTVLDASFPSSATLGGRVGSGADYLFGNVTFDAGTFTALKGEIVISAQVKGAGDVLPAGVEAAIWSKINEVSPSAAKLITKGYKWAYVVWDSPPLINVKFPSFYSHGFLLSDAKKAPCAAPVLTKVVAAMTKENAADKGEQKTVGKTALDNLKKIHTKAKAVGGSCPIKT